MSVAPVAQAAGAAGINQTINFQGRLLTATGAVVPDGTYNMEFQIWQDGNGCVTGCTSANAAANNGGTLKWTEDWIYGTGSPDNRVTIKNGYFSVALGSLTAFGTSVNWNWDTLYLTTNVGNTSSAASFASASPDGYMIPFKRLAANPYSLNSAALGGLTSSQYVQIGQGIQGAATTGSTALIGLNQTSTGNILDLQKGGADVLLVDSTGSSLFRPNSDSVTALQVQKAGTTTKVFTVDTSNSRIGIGNISPAYAVDAVGSVNASVSLKVAGTDVCTTSGCTASASSAILNQTTLQTSSNFYISGTGIANTSLLAPLLGTADQSAASTNSTNLVVRSGNANGATSNSGNITIDAGTATGTTGTISIGATNASGVTIGKSGLTVTMPGELSLSGTDTTTNNGRLNVVGSFNSSVTSSQYGFSNQMTFNPSGGSLTNLYGLNNSPTLAGSNYNLTTFAGSVTGVSTSAGYTGTVSSAYGLLVSSPTVSGSQLFNNYKGILINPASANTGNTAGTISNYGLDIAGSTAAAGSGGTLNNYSLRVAMPTGSGAGTTNNYGIQLTGSAAGTTSYSIYNVSSASSLFSASVQLGSGSSSDGTLVFANATNGNTSTLKTGTTSTSYTTVLPAAIGVAGQCVTVASVASTTQTLGYGTCAAGTVTLQGSTPGTPDSGNINVTGTIIAGTAVSTVNLTATGRISVGSGGTATGQLYVAGSVPTSATSTFCNTCTYTASTVQGKYAYIERANGNLTILDVTNPASPASVSDTATGLSGGYGNVVVSGRYAYMSGGTGSYFTIMDVSNPTAPTIVSTLSSGSTYGYAMTVQGRYAYILGGSSANTLSIIDIANPAVPVLVSTSTTATLPIDLSVQGKFAYVLSQNTSGTSFQTFDISNPQNPQVIGSIATGSTGAGIYNATALTVSGRYGYIANGGTTTGRVVDVSNPASPAVVGSGWAAAGNLHPVIQGQRVYIGSNSGGSVTVSDISSPTAPTVVGTISTIASLQMITVQGRYMYASGYSVNPSYGIYDLGGTYSQQLEAGGATLGSLNVDGDAVIGGNIRMQGSIGTAGVNAGTVATNSLNVASLSNDTLTGTVIGNTQVDPTGIISGGNNGSGAQMSANQFTTGPTTSTVSYLNVFVGNVDNSPNNHFQMAIYTDSSNAPTTKVVDSASVVLKPNSWNSVAITTTTLSANTKYWIAYNTDTSAAYFNNPAAAYNSTAASAFNGRTYASGYPTTFGCPCSTLQPLAMFASSTLPQLNMAAQVQNSSGLSALAVNAGAQTVSIAQIIAPTGMHITRSANTPTVANIGTAGSTSYSYAIAAIDDHGVLGQASPVQTTGTGNATLNGTNYNRVTLPSLSGNVASYNVYRTANGASATAIGLIGNTTSTTFNDQGATVLSKAIPSTTNSLSASTTYYYQVTAVDSGSGESAPSTEMNFATGATGRAITLSWYPQRGARGYKVYRGTSAGSEVYLATTTEPYFTDDGSITISALAVPTTGTAYTNQLGGNTGAQLSVGSGQAVGEVYVGINMPTAPISVATTGNNPDAMAVQGRYVYVGNYGDSTISVFDAGIPAKPVLVNTITTNGSSRPNFFTIAGKYLYVAGDNGFLQIYDISNPVTPTSVSSTATGTTPEVVRVQGRYAYVLNSVGATIQTFDVSNPATPVSMGTVATGTLPQSMTISGRYLYITNYTSATLGIYDLVNPASPVLVGSTSTVAQPYNIAIQGRYAYVVGTQLQVFDVSTPSTPFVVGAVSTSVSGPVSIVVQGRFAFVTGTGNAVEAYDISNPMNLVLMGDTPIKAGGGVGALAVQGRYLYAAGGGTPGYLSILDLGGTFTQSLEAGTAELGALTVRSSANIGDALNVAGGLNVGSGVGISGALSVAGNVNFQTQTNSTAAFTVQNSAGNTLLGVDTSGSNVNVGSTGSSTAASNVHIADTSSGTGVQAVTIGNANNTGNTVSIQGGTGATGIQIGSGNTAHGIQIGAGGTSTAQAIIIGSTGSSSSIAINSGSGNTALTTLGNTTINGISATVKSTTNNQNAFQIQNSAGTNQINVNTLTTDNNLWPNPSFEQSINGVATHGAGVTITQNSTDVTAQFGSSVLKTAISGTANTGAEFRYPFKGSTQYNISLWARVDTGSFSTFSIGRADNGTDVDCLSGATLTTTWTQFTCTSAFTTGTTIGATSSFYIRNTAASAKTMYIDGVTLVAGATALPYALPGSAMQVEPYANQVTFNAGNNGEIQPWQINANPLTLTRSRAAVTSANGYVYVMGGGTGGDGLTPSSTVYIAKANADGSLGTWSNNNSVALGTAVSGAGATVVNGYIYVIGGSTGAVGTSDSALVQYARLNSDGSTGAWSTTTALPAVRDAPGVTSANGAIQVMGGNTTSTTIATSLYAKVNQDGTISSWTSTSSMTSAEENIQPVVANGYVYVMGGSYSNATAADNLYQYAPINNDGSIGTWVNGGVMGVIRGDTGVVALNGRIYMMGGWDGTSNVVSTVYSALIMSDGSLGPLVQSANPLPVVSATTSQAGVENARAATVNGYIYMIGGDIGSGAGTAVSKVYYTSGPRLKVLGSLDLTSGNGTLTSPGSGGQLTAGNTLVSGTLQVADAANFVRSVNVMGQLTVGGNVEFRAATNSTTAFQVQNATGSVFINFDTTNSTITIGNGGNTVTFGSTAEPILAGTARHSKAIVLAPEYPGGVLDSASDTGGSTNCSTNNAGTMTSGYAPATFGQNYYNWTSTSGTAQCYDVVIQVPIPADFSAWNGAPSMYNYNSVGTDSTSVMVNVIDTNGTNDSNYSATAYNGVSSTTSFASGSMTSLGGTYNAGGYMTVKIRLTSSSSKNVRIGNLTFNYYSKY